MSGEPESILPPADPEEAIERLRARIGELETELATERAGRAAEKSAGAGELEQLRAQLAALTAPPAPKGKKLDGLFYVDE